MRQFPLGVGLAEAAYAKKQLMHFAGAMAHEVGSELTVSGNAPFGLAVGYRIHLAVSNRTVKPLIRLSGLAERGQRQNARRLENVQDFLVAFLVDIVHFG